MIECVCANCNILCLKHKSQMNKRTFCNKECYWEFIKNHPEIYNKGRFITGHKHTDESKLKMSFTRLANPYTGFWKGKKLSDETKIKISKAMTGNLAWNKNIPTPKDVRIKQSLSRKDKKREPHTEATKEKMRNTVLNKILDGYTPSIGKNETEYIDELEKLFGMKIERQYRACGYLIDGYIPELNLAIEIDEVSHFTPEGNLRQKDVIRQNNIEASLNCDFLRIADGVR